MTELARAPLSRFLSCALAAFALAGCGKQDGASSASSAASTPVATARVYVVGTDAAYAPFESQNEKGEIVGFDIDIVKAVAAKSGIDVKFVNTPWEGIFNALKQGDRDLLVSSITITDERKQTMDFSDPYFDAHQLIAVRADSRVARFDDLKTLKVGVQTGTTGDEAISKLQGKNSTDIKRFESTPLALKELETGGIDAVVADNGVVVNYVKNNSGNKFKTINDAAFVPEHYGIAVKKGNADLLAKLDQGPGRDPRRRHLRPHPRELPRRRRRCLRVRAGEVERAGRIVGLPDLRWNILVGYAPLFAQGLVMTLGLTVVALTGGLALGIVLGLVSSSVDSPRPSSPLAAALWQLLRGVTRAYVGFFRGTPLFVQILLVHFAVMPLLIQPDGGLLLSGEAAREFRQNHGAFFSGALALTLNAGAYISEILRAGIQSIHGGQTQAAYSVGLTTRSRCATSSCRRRCAGWFRRSSTRR